MNIFILVLVFMVILLVIFWQISTLISIWGGTQYVSTKADIFREIFRESKLNSAKTFYEFGSGFGEGLIIASREFGAKAYGVEISPFHYLASKIRTIADKNIKIIRANFHSIDLPDADIIYCYLFPKVLKKLSVKFKKGLKKNSLVISYAFPIQGLKPDKIKKVDNHRIFFYQF